MDVFLYHTSPLVSFYIAVYICNELKTRHEAYETKHLEKGVRNYPCVSEIKRNLQKPIHIRPVEKVENSVSKNKKTS